MNNTLVKQALTCPQYAYEQRQKGVDIKDNRPLATIGDKLLSFLFLEYVESINPDNSAEELTNLLKIVQDNEILNKIGKKLLCDNLEPMALNNDLEGNKGYATCLEAYLYAVYKTEGLKKAKKIIKKDIISAIKSPEIDEFIKKSNEGLETFNTLMKILNS